ncbi:uncharacterized protein BO97DRAFT_239994 [Aspergillus homomorphus CBS 101889]|uniref:Uncharacterized protein n=1 Tax=Aspergillus homomorphus (strain CBS 101889) TaxID=1450537 RepID=A0A395I5V2_ASPHC|nr:hypothetical protein BO97DRAFT_239994 [Aspergillus homomorphus CBS 101889]RAL15129.1 hypothetical protein BO97DRAFT_239994 [Aspergillus homomorphus CBS 101889]
MRVKHCSNNTMTVRYTRIETKNDLDTSRQHRQQLLPKHSFFRNSGLPWIIVSLSLLINIIVIYRLSRRRSEFPLREINSLVPECESEQIA